MLTFPAATLGVKGLSYSVHDYVQCTNCTVEKVPQWDKENEAYCDSRIVCYAVIIGSTFFGTVDESLTIQKWKATEKY